MLVKLKKSYKKIALALSLLAIIVWAILGTGASLAWFTDSSPDIKNVFNFAEFDLDVEYRLDDGVTYAPVESDSNVFGVGDLFEPGFTKVVYMRVRNNGTVPFNFQTAVILDNYTPGINVFGQSFNLQNYLRFGLLTAENDGDPATSILSEAQLTALVSKRENARAIATEEIDRYSSATERLEAGEETYMALVVYMPEEVGNIANYGIKQPEVVLGISVNATQVKE